MKEWQGAAGICINENNDVLMVRANNSRAWAVPSGGIEKGETPEECCVREFMEETGYPVIIKKLLFIKEVMLKGYAVKTYYYLVEKIDESSGIDDPDQLIEATDWKSLTDLQTVEHVYPEDKQVLDGLLMGRVLD